MLKPIITVAVCLVGAALLGEGEALTCYHCYDSFNNNTVNLRSVGVDFVRCDRNQNKWNTWECPREFPICVITSAKVQGHVEIVRTCAQRDFCSIYQPPPQVIVETCRECNTTLCNAFLETPLPTPSPTPKPQPPAEPDALFTFNININLNLRNYAKTNKGLK